MVGAGNNHRPVVSDLHVVLILILIPLIPALVLGTWLLWADVARRRWERRTRRGMGSEARALADGFVVLRGRLRHPDAREGVAAASSVPDGAGWRPTISAWHERLELETMHQRIPLLGPAEVILSAQNTSLTRLSRRIDEAGQGYHQVARTFPHMVPALITPQTSLHLLHLGDEVLASGRLERRAHPDSPAGYRESAHRWILTGGQGPTLLAAACPRPPRVSWWGMLLVTLVISVGLVMTVGLLSWLHANAPEPPPYYSLTGFYFYRSPSTPPRSLLLRAVAQQRAQAPADQVAGRVGDRLPRPPHQLGRGQ